MSSSSESSSSSPSRKSPRNEKNHTAGTTTKESTTTTQCDDCYCFHVMKSSIPLLFSGPILFSNTNDFQKFVDWCNDNFAIQGGIDGDGDDDGSMLVNDQQFDILQDAIQYFEFLLVKNNGHKQKQKKDKDIMNDISTANTSGTIPLATTTTTTTTNHNNNTMTMTQTVTTGTATGAPSILQHPPTSKPFATSTHNNQTATASSSSCSPSVSRVHPTATNAASLTEKRSISNMKAPPAPIAYRSPPPPPPGISHRRMATSLADKAVAVAAAPRRGPPFFQPFPSSYHGPPPLPHNGPHMHHGLGPPPPPPPRWVPLPYAYPPPPPPKPLTDDKPKKRSSENVPPPYAYPPLPPPLPPSPPKLTADEQRQISFDKEFDEKILLLKDFKSDYGDTDVPQKKVVSVYKTEKGQVLDMTGKYKGLGVWVSKVRTQMQIYIASKTQSLLSDTQVGQLKALSFCMTSKRNEEIKTIWKKFQYQKLLRFFHDCGHSDPKSKDNQSLSIWCADLRKAYQLKEQGKFVNLTDDHISKLKEIQFDFNIQPRGGLPFDERVSQWLAYRAENDGKDPISSRHSIHQWMTRVRREYTKKKQGQPYLHTVLTDERIVRLTNLGFVWESKYKQAPKLHKRKTLEERIQELLEYKKRYGNCLVPQKFPSLGGWVQDQRTEYNKKLRGEKSTMTEERLQKLKDIGFSFEKQADGPRFLKATGELQVLLKTRGLVAKQKELQAAAVLHKNANREKSNTMGKDLVSTVLGSTTTTAVTTTSEQGTSGTGIGQILAATQTANNAGTKQPSDTATDALYEEEEEEEEEEQSVVSASNDHSTSEDSLENFTAPWL